MLFEKIKNRIMRLFSLIYNSFVLKFFSYAKNADSLLDDLYNCEEIFNKYKCIVKNNSDVTYSVELQKIPKSEVAHKWVGAQVFNGNVVGIPNDEESVLINQEQWALMRVAKRGRFKWTGGGVWNNRLYCFPRTSNSFLVYDGEKAELLHLDFKYDFEHHYSGVLCNDIGVVYQPPRNTNHILKTDLKTNKSKKILILPDSFNCKLSYCGSVRHPNGYIYFLPVSGCKVIKLNPLTDDWCFIGKPITTFCFDAKVGIDGNIYGFNHWKGIVKIDVVKNLVSNIHSDIRFYAYGTKVGLNGKLYSIPGDSSNVFEYDIQTDSVKVICTVQDTTDAKFAGGVTDTNGVIYGVPAEEEVVICYKPSRVEEIPHNVYQSIYLDNY